MHNFKTTIIRIWPQNCAYIPYLCTNEWFDKKSMMVTWEHFWILVDLAWILWLVNSYLLVRMKAGQSGNVLIDCELELAEPR